MEPIRIKTPVYEIRYKVPVREFTYYNKDSFFKRLVKRSFFRKIKKETVKIPGRPDFEPLIIDIKDEVNLYKWVDSVYNVIPSTYKKDLVVEDRNGNEFILHGCFPVKVYLEGTRAKIVYDYFTVIKGEYING